MDIYGVLDGPMETRTAVLLCTHNGEKYISELLESLAKQTLPPDEIWILDWGSEDETARIIRSWMLDLDGSIKVNLELKRDAPGASKSFIAGMRHCLSRSKFDYLFLCDQDDVWTKNKIKIYIDALHEETGSSPSLLSGDVRVTDADLSHISNTYYGQKSPFKPPDSTDDPVLILANPFIGMTMCLSRPLVEEAVKWGHGPWIMHDWMIALIAQGKGYRSEFIATPTVCYRQHPNNLLGGRPKNPVAYLRGLANLRCHLRSRSCQLEFLLSNDLLAFSAVRNWSTLSYRSLYAAVLQSGFLSMKGKIMLVGLLIAGFVFGYRYDRTNLRA